MKSLEILELYLKVAEEMEEEYKNDAMQWFRENHSVEEEE